LPKSAARPPGFFFSAENVSYSGNRATVLLFDFGAARLIPEHPPPQRAAASSFIAERHAEVCEMDYDFEIRSLAAETLAIQAALSNVLYELKSLDARFADAIARGFDKAASQVEDRAIEAGKTVPPEHLTKAVRIIEELRAASVGRVGQPKSIV
jgi:hypothetical protein